MIARNVFVLLCSALISACSMLASYTGEDVNQPVREHGIPAVAEILEVWDTNIRYNHHPVVGFRLRVSLKDGHSYEATTRNAISVVIIPQYQPGAVIPVKVDPQDNSRVAIDIASPTRQSARSPGGQSAVQSAGQVQSVQF